MVRTKEDAQRKRKRPSSSSKHGGGGGGGGGGGAGGGGGGGGKAAAGNQKRRGRRVDKAMLAELYAMLYARMPQPVTEAGLSKEFSDKELRVLMKHNGMLINDYDQRSGSYNEKTKTSKCKILVEAVPTMIIPGTEVDVDSPPSDSGTQRRKSTKGGSKPRAQARGSSSSGGGGGGRARPGQAARSTPAAARPQRGSASRKTYAEDSDDDSDDSEDERPLKLRAGDQHFNGANAAGESYRGSAGFFAAQGLGGAGRSQPTPWPPPEPSQLQSQHLQRQQRQQRQQLLQAAEEEQTLSPSRLDPFAARPSLNKLAFDMGGDDDPSPGRTEKDVMYLGGELGLLDDDGSQLRPVEEPSTDPEPWKVFTPLSYQPGQGESLVEMMTNTVTNTVGAGVNILRRLASPNAAQGQNYDAFAAAPPPQQQAGRQQTGRKAEAAHQANSGSVNGGGTSWWERFSPTAATAKAKTADATFSVPPPREPASARTSGSSSSSTTGGVSTATADTSGASWWTRFSPRAADTGAESGGGWWGFSPRYASHPNASLGSGGGGGFGFNPFASTGDASALAAQAAAQSAATDPNWPS